MKSLVIMSYRQPLDGNRLRVGVVEVDRNTKIDPPRPSAYRWLDPVFCRSTHLLHCRTWSGWRRFYAERTNWEIRLPVLGSIYSGFLKIFGK